MAIGDALGVTTEFLTKEDIQNTYGKVTDIIGGGVWRLQPGETTDDTAMTIAVAKGIVANPEAPLVTIGEEFLKWYETSPKYIGNILRMVFETYQGDWFHAAEEVHHRLNGKSAGNGSLMRCLPVALAYPNINEVEAITHQQSKMTHYDELAAEACIIYNRIAWRLLQGESLQSALEKEVAGTRYASDLTKVPNVPPNGFVVNTMHWVLYWLAASETFEDVVIGATNMGDDSDTIAAIAGGLKGIEVGSDKLPPRFPEKLRERDELLQLADELCNIYSMKHTDSFVDFHGGTER